MQKPSLGQAWRLGLALIALLATATALYVQLFERRSRETDDRLAAARLDEALAASRTRLKAEILSELRAELASGGSPAQPGNQPLPNSVLRRGESGTGSTLQQLQDLRKAQESTGEKVASQPEDDAGVALRRDFDELRAEVRREREVSGRVVSLLLAALGAVVVLVFAGGFRS
jgi:hypothetical protein